MLTGANHGLQVAHPWKIDRVKLCSFDILMVLSSQLCEYTPTLDCMLILKFNGVCAWGALTWHAHPERDKC